MLFKNTIKQRKPLIKRNNFKYIKTAVMTTCLALGLTVTTAYAEGEKLETVFHVYIDGEHIGKISDESIIQDIVEEKLEAKEDDYENANLTIGENITYISEKVFNPSYQNEKVAKQVEEEISVMAEAIELKIGKNTVGFFRNHEIANEVIKEYKLKYVDENVLERIEEEKKQTSDVENRETEHEVSLELGESRISDVTLTEAITTAKGKTLPNELLTKEQGLNTLEKGTLVEKTHQVDEGEVLSEIASQYDLSMEELLEINPTITKDSVIQIGQDVNVLDYEPFVNVIVKEEELVEETISYETVVKESEDLYKGEETVKQEGRDGKKEVHYAIEKVNGSEMKKEKLDETITLEPVKKVIVKGTKVIPSRGTGELTNPTVGGYISSKKGQRWGRSHKGIDIAGPSNRSILAVDNGVVESAGYNNGGYGNRVIINHNNGMKTVYAHLASIDVNAGQTVEKGHKIGVMGSTGNSTGIHLHFEVYKNGALKDPLDYVY